MPKPPDKMTFARLGLAEALVRAVGRLGYHEPTPVQRAAIPAILGGRDLLGIAQTGTGKTAAFALPVLQHIASTRARRRRVPLALVLCPTRELATQTGILFGRYGKYLDVRHYVLYGGVPREPQVAAMAEGADVVVATPGRLLDLHAQGHVALDGVRHLVLDEADRLLDMGFLPDIQQVVKAVPSGRQTLLFSATMPPPVEGLATSLLRDAVRVEVTPQATPVDRIDQHVMYVARLDKAALLAHLVTEHPIRRGLAFCRTRRGAERLAELLARQGIRVDALHGERTQAQRAAAMEALAGGRVDLLVATDVAARGLDVPDVDVVVNVDLPVEAETYVHRIGRTGRADRAGLAITLCDETDGGLLRDVERLVGAPLVPQLSHPWHSHAAIPAPDATGARRPAGRRKRRRRR